MRPFPRLAALLALLFCLALALPGHAQVEGSVPPGSSAVPVESPAVTPAAPQPAAPAPTVAPAPPPPAAATPANPDLQRLIEALRDDARRAELLRALETLAGQPPPPPAPPAPPAPQPPPPTPVPEILAPNTLGAQLLVGASQRLQALSDSLVAGAQALTDLPGVASWAAGVARDPVTQARVLDASWKLALLFGLGLLAEWATTRWLRRWSDRLDALAPENGDPWTWVRRVPLVAARFVLDLVPVAAFAVISYGMIGFVRPLPTTELVLLTTNNAYIALRAVMAASRVLFSPASTHLRLVPVLDETAAYVTVWIRRIAVVGITGYAVAESGLLFGLPWSAYDAVLRISALVMSLFLVIVVLQNRAAVSDALRAPVLSEDAPTPDSVRRLMRGLRDRLADVWHLLAILWLMALWGVWALEVRDGFERLLRVSATTILVVALAKGADVLMRRTLAHSFEIGADMARRYPGLEARANRYVPVLKAIASGIIAVMALLFLLEAWGIEAFGWFGRGKLGARLLTSLVSIGITTLVAVTIWELANAAIHRYLTRLQRDAQAARSARVRTLLPMLRTVLSATIMIFVALNVLTEIGVNVAPLIAGAGVLGLAIGFGSQTLVRDVITGVFLLFEDAVAVGDVVQVGGLSGVVEQLSIRSIKLRATDGSVHIIPFSAVTTVTNMTRDFAFAVVDVLVGYGEDTDRVAAMLREVAAEIRADPKFRPMIRDDIDVWGVDKMTDTGIAIRARIKTDPAARWAVGREFNRRIKQHCDRVGIEIAYKSPTMILQRPAAPRKPA